MTLKTTPIIDEINDIAAARDTNRMHEMAVRFAAAGSDITALDCLALGRALGYGKNHRYHSAWQQLMPLTKSQDKLAPSFRIAIRVGNLAARVERFNFGEQDALSDPDLSRMSVIRSRIDHTDLYLAIAHTTARFHPDQDVSNIATWAEGHLEQHRAKQMRLIPE